MPTADNQALVHCCREMKALLEKDAAAFKANRMNEFMESNVQKSELLAKINELIQKKAHQGLSPVELKEINKTVKACQTLMAINSQVVHTNLYRLKCALNVVINKENPKVNLYDNKGRTT